MIDLVGWAGSAAAVGWIPRLLLRLVVRMQTPHLAAWFGGEDADRPQGTRGGNRSLSSGRRVNGVCLCLSPDMI